jgi:MFS family permease
MGGLADRFGRRPLIWVSLAAYVVAFSGYLFAPSAGTIILLRAFAGAFTAGLVPAVTGLVADLAPQERRAQWIGFLNAGSSFGWVAGPIAGGLIYDRWGYGAANLVAILLAILTFLIALVAIPEIPVAPTRSLPGAERKGTVPFPKKIRIFLLHLRSSLPNSLSAFAVLLSIFFAVLFAWAFIEPRFMFYAYDDLGWSSSMLGLVMSTYGAAMVVGELAFGRLSDRLGRRPVILLGLVLFSAQFVGLAYSRNYMLVAAAFILAGLGNALYDPALSASFIDISPEEHRSLILGIKSMVGSSGNILGPALLALMNSSMDVRTVFQIAAGAVLLTSLLALVDQARERTSRKGFPSEIVSGNNVSTHT